MNTPSIHTNPANLWHTNIRHVDGTMVRVASTRYALPRSIVHNRGNRADVIKSDAMGLVMLAKDRAAEGKMCDAGDYATGCEVYYFDGTAQEWRRGTVLGHD